MQNIRSWLLAGAPFWLFFCFLPVLVFFCWNLAQAGIDVVSFVSSDLPISGTTRNYALELQRYEVHEIAFRSFVLTPLREEFVYRVLPFGFVWAVWFLLYGKTPPLTLALLTVLVTSVVFGYAHGGSVNVFVQGLIGIVIAFVFLLWSAYGRTPVRGIAAILILHGSYNFYVAMVVKQQLVA